MKRILNGMFLLAGLMLSVAACGMEETGKVSGSKGGPELTTVNLSVSLPSETQNKAGRSALAIPVPVGSVVLEVRTPDCADPIAYTETQNVTVGQTTVSYSFQLPSGSTACFIVRAYSGADGTGTLLYEGTTSGIVLDPNAAINVQVNLDLVGTLAPTVSTLPATGVTSLSATLQGLVNPNGYETVAYFEWQEFPSGPLTGTPILPIGAGTADVPVNQVINGLTPGTDYQFRAVGSNSGNLVFGSFVPFTTPVSDIDITINFPNLLPPTVTTDAASNVTATGAQLNATVNPEGTETNVYFEWGTDTSYGNTTALQNVGNGTTNTFPTAALTGLAEGTTYHARAVAYNAGGITYGADQSFVTGTSSSGVTPMIAGGAGHTLGIDSNGTLWVWGSNLSGQLGNGTTVNSPVPIQVNGISSMAVIPSGGENHSVVSLSDGTAWSWGGNFSGELGNGATTNSSTPVQVTGLTNLTGVASGSWHNVALKSDGTVWTWGQNGFGQLGVVSSELCLGSTIACSTTPIQVGGLSNVIAVKAGRSHTMALKNDGTVWTWGLNDVGQLGAASFEVCSTLNCSTTPIQVEDPSDPSGYLTNVVDIAAGFYHTAALKTDGSVWRWGYDGTSGASQTPLQVPVLTQVAGISANGTHTHALKADGTAWSWGANGAGQLGDGTTTWTNTPVQVSGLSQVVALEAGGSHGIALLNDGTIWAWGNNGAGQLGNGSTADSLIPVQVTGLNLN